MSEGKKRSKWQQTSSSVPGTGLYGLLAFIGAVIYYVQRADGAGEIIVAFLKAVVWPAFVLYELMGHLAM